MLKVRNLVKSYKDRKVLSSFSYEFKKKGLYVVTGKSGCGKSTLLNILSGWDKEFKGDLFIDGSVFHLKDKDNLVSHLTVRENIYLFELVNDKQVNYLFDIKKLLNKKVKKLSLGEKQLVELLLAFNCSDNIIILDEPFSALSRENINKCVEVIERLKKEKLIIIASHEVSCFNKCNIIDLEKKVKRKVKKFDSFILNKKREFKFVYYLFYLKKVLFSKLIFVMSIAVSILSFLFINNYSDNVINSYLSEFYYYGTLVEKKNNIKEINDNVFYEVSKRLSKYISNYNARYYSASMYDENIIIDNYYIDNGIALSSFEYIEKDLNDNEVVMGLNYHTFCINNNLFNCDEGYLKAMLVNKKVNGFDIYIKDIINGDFTSFYVNERFYKIKEENDYVEYYLDIKKDYLEDAFKTINRDDLLASFSFSKISENIDIVRFRVELSESKRINSIDYDEYIVCLDKGYNCYDYLNHFKSLVKIDNFNNTSSLNLGVVTEFLTLDEIVVSSSLSEYLNKGKGETIKFYFNYDNYIKDVDLIIKDVISEKDYFIYHNSNWSYSFFKDIVGFKEQDLMVDNVVIFEDLKEGYIVSEDIYKEMIGELEYLFLKIKKITFVLNTIVTLFSIIVMILLEIFNNKFKKEYFSYLKQLNVEKKNA